MPGSAGERFVLWHWRQNMSRAPPLWDNTRVHLLIPDGADGSGRDHT